MAYLESTSIHLPRKFLDDACGRPICSSDPRVILNLQEKGYVLIEHYNDPESLLCCSIDVVVLLPDMASSPQLSFSLPAFILFHWGSESLYSTNFSEHAANVLARSVSTSRMARSPVRDVQKLLGVHLFGIGQRPRIPNRLGL